MKNSPRDGLLRGYPEFPGEADLWDAVCHAMNGTSIFTSNSMHLEQVIRKLGDNTWRNQMRPEFLQGLLDVAVADLEYVTFCEVGAVAQPLEDEDVFEINLDLDRMKAQNARRLAAALKQHLAPSAKLLGGGPPNPTRGSFLDI